MKLARTTIIYTHGGGRFGNQLLRFFHWLAWVTEDPGKRRIVNMAFWPYARLFHPWASSPGCVYPTRSVSWNCTARARLLLPLRYRGGFDWRVARWVAAAARHLPKRCCSFRELQDGESLDIGSTGEMAPFLTEGGLTVFSGWQFTCWDLLLRHADEVRSLFRSGGEHAQSAAEFLRSCRERAEILIGLFIRRDDYRYWNEGRYFFPIERYVVWAREAAALFPGCRVRVILAGDERLDDSKFSGVPVELATGTINSGGHWFESFLELSGCDLILSPPSTFSACAAFLGRARLLPLRASEQRLDLSDALDDHLFGASRDPDFSQAVH